MPLAIVRFRHLQQVRWGMLEQNLIYPLSLPCTTTADLISLGYNAVAAACQQASEALADNEVELLSPITQDAKVLCQGANYRQHMIDSGMDPDEKSFNMFFTKSSASITSPAGHIVRPDHVQLLDYEVELTLVLAKATHSTLQVNDSNLHEYVAGICIGNDVSARDVQIPQMQFHKGKSYRTFCPLGPVLCLLHKDDLHYLSKLQLSLSVNGQVRQNDNTANMVFKAAETLSEYSQIVDFKPGDILMTGTPSGCALGLPSPLLVRISALLPEKKRWQLFVKSQQKRQQYLNNGDIIEASIKSADGVINLGHQRHTVVGGAV